MTYVVLPHTDHHGAFHRWTVTDGMGRRYGAEAQVDAIALAAMLNMLTPDQRQAASVDAVAQWKDTTDAA